jgi:dolichyl-diphosphooligosaccharide--protein glycosyltransferase
LLARVATPFLLFVVAIVFRILSWHSVFQQGGVYPQGNDAYYHLRRIQYSVEHFPSVLSFDPLINFPQGGEPIWPATFDWLIAALLRPWPGIGTPATLERVAVWIPPLVGAATVVLVYAIGVRFFSRRVGVLAGALLAVLPAHVIYSRLGALDHHVAVAAMMALMLAAALALLRATSAGAEAAAPAGAPPGLDGAASAWSGAAGGSGGDGRAWNGMTRSLWLGIAMGFAVLLWPGSLLHVGLLQILLVLGLLGVSSAERASAWALRFGVVHATAGLVVTPFAWGREWQVWGAMSPVVLTSFQPLYFFAAALCFFVVGTVWSRGWASGSRATRALSAAAVGAVVLALAFLFVPDLAASIGDALDWFSKQEGFQSVVNESVPLFAGLRGVRRAAAFLGWLVFAVPPMLLYLAVVYRRRPDVLLLAGWGAGLFAATLVQWRFMNAFAVPYALLVALTLDDLGRRWLGAGEEARADRLRTGVALGVLALALLPSFRSYAQHLDNWGRSLRGAETVPVGQQRHARRVVDAARALRALSPSPDVEAYSVLGPWGDGHILKYVAGRPVVQDNFGDDAAPENFQRAEAYFSARSEEEALEVVAPLATRYVLVRSTGSGQSAGYARDSLFQRLYRRRGTAGRRPPVEPLHHHRLVYQSEPLGPGETEPYCLIFEIVPGAEIVGRAEPGATVTARLSIEPRRGPGFVYEARAVADAAGTWSVRVPYSSEPSSGEVRTGAHYGIRSGGHDVTLDVPEAAVLRGLRIEAPPLDG